MSSPFSPAQIGARTRLIFALLVVVGLALFLDTRSGPRPGRAATRSNGATDARLSSSVITISPTSLPDGEVGASYSQKLTAKGGSSPYTYALIGGGLPLGLSMSSSGAITGVPSTEGPSSFTVSATDPNHFEGAATISLAIDAGPSVATTSLPAATATVAYSTVLVASGGTAPYAWSIPSGGIPGGLVLSSGGTLSGIPASPGSYTITLRVTDALGSLATVSLPITVAPAPPPAQDVDVLTSAGVVDFDSGVASVVLTRTSRDVAIASAPHGGGGLVVTAKGAVRAFGDEHAHGSVGRRYLSGRVVAIASSPVGEGYLVATSTGRVYGFGGAKSHGSVKGGHLHGHIVAMAITASGNGYWIVSSSGQVYAFGDAARYGSVSLAHRRGQVVGMATGPGGKGYWVAMSTGVVFGRGPSCKGAVVHKALPVIGIAPARNGTGYWLLSRSGTSVAIGSARGLGAFSAPRETFRAISAGA